MTDLTPIEFAETDLDALAGAEGKLAVLVTADGKLDPAGRRVNRLTKQAVSRLVDSERWGSVKPGEGVSLEYPAGLAATALMVVKLDRRPSVEEARKAGAIAGQIQG